MHAKILRILILAVATLGGGAAGSVFAGDAYVGASGGKILLTDSAQRSLHEDHYSGGLSGGIGVVEFGACALAAEADVSFPLAKGTTDNHGAWKLSTAGVYGALRIGKRNAYLKLKAGLLYENLDVELLADEDGSDLGLSAGLGVGARLGERLFLELEGAFVDKDMGYLRGGLGYRL